VTPKLFSLHSASSLLGLLLSIHPSIHPSAHPSLWGEGWGEPLLFCIQTSCTAYRPEVYALLMEVLLDWAGRLGF